MGKEKLTRKRGVCAEVRIGLWIRWRALTGCDRLERQSISVQDASHTITLSLAEFEMRSLFP